MYAPLKQYDALLADIKRQISRMKTDISPWAAVEMGNEIQSHLNRVMADVSEQANTKYDCDGDWVGTVCVGQRTDRR